MAKLAVEIPDDLHGRLKALASLKRMSIREIVIDWAQDVTKVVPDLKDSGGDLTYKHGGSLASRTAEGE